jgi:hypothetical protein
MKVKLLKKLRKQCSWKPIQRDGGGIVIEEWILLQLGVISYYSSTEQVLYEMLRRNADYQNSWNRWDELLHKQRNKMAARQFKRMGNSSGIRRQVPPPLPPLDRWTII